MSLSLRKKIAAGAMAIAAGGGVAALVPASPAVAYFSPPLFIDVVVEGPGHLVARGAGVEIPVEVTCNPGAVASVQVHVTQSVNGKIARGVGYADVGCTGGHQRLLLTAVAQSNRAFAVGRALVVANAGTCIPEACGNETDQRTIPIRK